MSVETNLPTATANIQNAASNLSSALTNGGLSNHALGDCHFSLFWAVGISALLATFVASVMADEQNERLKNGTFGAIAGSSIGGIAALLTSQHALLITGFLGSAIGGFFGWLAILWFSYKA